MKIFSAADPVSRVRARNCFLVNQFATPGLGSLLGGKFLAGMGQLALALTGFALVSVWFVSILSQAYHMEDLDSVSEVKSSSRFGEAGALVFLASWFWALVTSLRLLRQSKQAGPADPPIISPEKISVSPSEKPGPPG
jgi:hypothetical protein